MKKTNQNNPLNAAGSLEIIFKKVLNLHTRSMDTIAFVFYKN